MRYFVISDDGQKYGPADITTLQTWISEGRLLSTQQVEEEGSGARMAAQAVPGLRFAPQGPQQPVGGPYQPRPGEIPSGSPYNRPAYQPVGDNGQNDVTMGWVFGACGIVICCLFGPLGFFFANRAVQKGNSGGNAAKIFCIVVMSLQAVLIIGYIIFGVVMATNASSGTKF